MPNIRLLVKYHQSFTKGWLNDLHYVKTQLHKQEVINNSSKYRARSSKLPSPQRLLCYVLTKPSKTKTTLIVAVTLDNSIPSNQDEFKKHKKS